ncbi:cytochrome P450 [Nocardiopsis potens]|uniref:cytochrome P450 n=1 Tax=Nocardiopsis potens TaxID=1246458 RepID=UPI00034D731D|nr:cytochrome P450 [Nocardiopsis potens]
MTALDGAPGAPPVPPPEPGSAGSPCGYAALRAAGGPTRAVLPQGETVWLVTRYEQVQAALADPRLVRPVISTWPPGRGEGADRRVLTLLELNGPAHRRVRGAVSPAFAPRRLERFAPRVRALAEEAADRMAARGGSADLVADFTGPFPVAVLCALLGIAPGAEEGFRPLVETVLRATLVPLEQILGALSELQDFAAALVDRQLREPGGDVLGELAAGSAAEGGLDRDELVTFTVSMLMAGYKTNVQHFAAALFSLLGGDGGPARPLSADPPEALVEELLRYVPLMNAIVLLVAEDDLELGGAEIRRGDAVMPVLASANRDGAVFDSPDELHPGRAPNPHLVFGRGPHYCLGAHLTRMQLRIGLGVLADRFPGLRLAVRPDEVEWDDTSPLRAPLRLPVRW